MKKTTILVSLALIVSLFVRCDDPVPITSGDGDNTTFASLSAYMATKTVGSETFQFTAENGGTHTTAKGSKITIPADAFVSATGQAVTGPVDFKMKEVFSNAEIMFSGVFPVSYGQVLNSGGEFYVEAKSNGKKLKVKPGQAINVVIPAQAEDPNMMLFLGGNEENQDSMEWEAEEDSSRQGRNGFTFNSADKTYSIDLDSMGWANIDAFDWTIKYFDCEFDLTGVMGLSNANTTAFAVFKEQNAVWPVGVAGWGDITDNLISESHLGSVAMNLLVISVVDEQLYYGLKDFTPVDGTKYTIEMKETTSDDLDALISSFE